MSDQAQRLRELAKSGVFESTIAVPDGANVMRGAPYRGCTVIAVTSGKGGVGKTNIALFLSIALARLNKRVLLVDADLGLSNVHLLLGIAPRRNLSHVVSGECGLEAIVTRGPGNVDLVPGAGGIEAMADLSGSKIAELRRMFHGFEQSYDFMIIDSAAGIGASVVGMAQCADLSLVVLTPEPPSLADAYAMVKVLHGHGARHCGSIVNMALSDREAEETFDRLDTLVVKFLQKRVRSYGSLPFDRDVARYVKKQRVIVLDDPNGRFAGRLGDIAARIAALPQRRRGGFFGRVLHHDGDRGGEAA